MLSDRCEKILYALVLTLVFEGILRKLLPPLSTAIFFIKDLLCVLGLILVRGRILPDIIARVSSIKYTLFLLFIPLLYCTGFKDPILALFASKQYLLYIIIGIMVAVSFPGQKEEQFRKFVFFTSLLLLPTVIVAILQNSLPASHWLNLSVGGQSLERFASAGYLRVASTFSFTGQYSWFLVAESFFLATSFFMQPNFSNRFINSCKPLFYSLLAILLVVSAFITGGRTAVLGCGTTLVLGLFIIGSKRPGWFVTRGLAIICFCIFSLSILKTAKPEFFAAYEQRASGHEDTSHSEEVTTRVLSGFTEWTEWFWEQDAISMIVGNGLGVMSNGSGAISSYAARIRETGFWTEGDVATTLWEGGLYLAFIWYGFRLSLIFLCYKIWRSVNDKLLASAISVPFAYVIISGITSQFGLQPPLLIWWWFSIGIMLFIYRFDRYRIANHYNT